MYYSKSVSDSDFSSSGDECTVITANGKTHVIRGGGVINFGGIQIGNGRTRVLKGHRKSHNTYSTKHNHDSPSSSHGFAHYGEPSKVSEYSIGRKELSDSNDPPSRSDLNYVSNHIGWHWKSLASALGLSRGQIEAIESDFRIEGQYEMAYQTLLKWQRHSAGCATIKDLVQVLDSIGMTEIAVELPIR